MNTATETLKTEYLTTMRAERIPAAWSNLWFVHKLNIPANRLSERHGKMVTVPCGDYTYLRRVTDKTIYELWPGDVVMEDTPFELRTHLGFVMNAYGNVLVTGLGLGCVLRGLLKNPKVEHITCIENSPDVLKLVAPYMPTDRLTIVEADALKWTAANKIPFDVAWHDLWTNPDNNEPHLDIWHQRLLIYCRKFVKQQGAWAFRRDMRRLLASHGIQWIG